ncbi:hypothetical protein RB600_001485 [Gaeumannomyces tritici]
MAKSNDESSSQLASIPYFATPDRLPGPLPTDAEIRGSKEVLRHGSGRRVVRVGQHYVVKYGANVSLTEGQNMHFVRETCGIPTPQVFAFYTRTLPSGTSCGYIVMEYIHGEALVSRWDNISDEAKSNTCRQLRAMLDKIRNIPSQGYFGCIGRRPMEDGIFWTSPEFGAPKGLIDGPFDTEDQLVGALVDKYRLMGGSPNKAGFYSRVLPQVLLGHAPVFTHGDLQPKNILIGSDGQLVLIDWESAGWYPSYWEYAVAMFACGDWGNDWHEYVADMLDEYPNEYVWFDMLKRELWS